MKGTGGDTPAARVAAFPRQPYVAASRANARNAARRGGTDGATSGRAVVAKAIARITSGRPPVATDVADATAMPVGCVAVLTIRVQ